MRYQLCGCVCATPLPCRLGFVIGKMQVNVLVQQRPANPAQAGPVVTLWTTVVDCQLLNLDIHTHTYSYTNDCAHTKRQKNIDYTEICTQLCPYSSVRCDFYLSVSGDFGNFGKRSSERSRVSVSVDFQASALLLLPPQHP